MPDNGAIFESISLIVSFGRFASSRLRRLEKLSACHSSQVIMAHANGIKAPPTRENNAIGKRKRSFGTEATESTIQHNDSNDTGPRAHVDFFQELLLDILKVLDR